MEEALAVLGEGSMPDEPIKDQIVPIEKRRPGAHHPTTGKPRGRPRKTPVPAVETPPHVTPVEAPGIVQAAEVHKSEVDTVTDDLTTLYGTLGTFLMFVNQYDGFIVISNSENMSKSVVAACHPYPQAWKVLKMVTQGNTWTVLVLAHLGPALAIAANHGLVKPQVAQAFRQPLPPNVTGQEAQQQYAPGPYTYPGETVAQSEQELSAEQQMAIMQYIAEQAAAQGQYTVQQQRAQYAPPPIANGNVGMDSAGGLGDQSAAAERAAFTAAQIARIREESLRKTQDQSKGGNMSGL